MHEGCGLDNTLHQSAADQRCRTVLGVLVGTIARPITGIPTARPDPVPNDYTVQESGRTERPGTSA